MTSLENAQFLIEKGFSVFRIKPGTKIPYRKGWQKEATADLKQAEKLFGSEPSLNVGVVTNIYKIKHKLLILDVDVKHNKKGDLAILQLEMEGCSLPPTDYQVTPSGGRHLIYSCDQTLKHGTNLLGNGLDVLTGIDAFTGAGSSVDGGMYTYVSNGGIAEAPTWLCDRLTLHVGAITEPELPITLTEDDQKHAYRLAKDWLLQEDTPISIENAGGDAIAFKVLARVKDFGVEQDACLDLVTHNWNERCVPPWSDEELQDKVRNVYAYGQNQVGVDSPANIFKDVVVEDNGVLHPFERLNQEYSVVTAGGKHHVLWETQDFYGRYRLEHLNAVTMHIQTTDMVMQVGEKQIQASRLWMGLPPSYKDTESRYTRKSYKGIIFDPKIDPKKSIDHFNTWKGFAIPPADPDKKYSKAAIAAKAQFLDHIWKNVCLEEQYMFEYLIGFLAHIIQKPWEKPHVALVFRGRQGVGKNSVLDVIVPILGNHALIATDNRYLISNFNLHLEGNLLIVYDEAIWSGDKASEGKLKGLITGKTHVIEPKGKDTYTVTNLSRVCLLSNADWVIPAAEDERRFAVFDFGEDRKRDYEFFRKMEQGMKGGGYELVHRHLLDHDNSNFNIHMAPETKGLLNQKIESLTPIGQWWYDCLMENLIFDYNFILDKGECSTQIVRTSFNNHVRTRNIRTRLPNATAFGMWLSKTAPSITKIKGPEGYAYIFPSIERLRLEFDTFIGGKISWSMTGVNS